MAKRTSPQKATKELGFYHVEQVLGEGAMGEIFLCRDPSLDRLTVVKRMKQPLRGGKDLVERFSREVRLTSHLQHSAFPEIYFYWKQDHYLHVAMEYVEGETFREILNRKVSLSGQMVMTLAEEILAGFAVAHKKQVIHRDIKPANLMLSKDGQVKILDFGVARELEDQELTMPGTLIGTSAYMAPEQARGGVATPASDLFSMGIVFFEALAGVHPFRSNEAEQTLENILHREPDWSLLRGKAPKKFISLIRTLLQKSASSRPQDAGAALALFRQLGLPKVNHAKEFLMGIYQEEDLVETVLWVPKKNPWLYVLGILILGTWAMLAWSGMLPDLPWKTPEFGFLGK